MYKFFRAISFCIYLSYDKIRSHCIHGSWFRASQTLLALSYHDASDQERIVSSEIGLKFAFDAKHWYKSIILKNLITAKLFLYAKLFFLLNAATRNVLVVGNSLIIKQDRTYMIVECSFQIIQYARFFIWIYSIHRYWRLGHHRVANIK